MNSPNNETPAKATVSEENAVAAAEKPDKFMNRLWWQIGALLAVSAIAVFTGSYFDRQLERFMPETRALSSTYNGKASGLEALAELTDKLGKPARRWELPYRQLPGTNGTLLLIAPLESLKDFEADQILKWVKAGNTLIYLDDFTLAMSRIIPEKLGVKAKILTKKLENHKFDAKNFGALPEFTNVNSLIFSTATRLEGGKPVVSNTTGTFISEIAHGKGRVLVGCCPDFCANRTIAKQDYWGNFQFLQNLFSTNNGTIYFDERAHGFSGGTNVFLYLSRGPVGAVTYQVLLILAIAVVSGSQRFGAAQAVDEKRRISNLEFINGLSNAYRRARANPAVAEILFQEFRKKLARSLGISPHEPVEKLKEAWQGLPAEQKAVLLAGDTASQANLEQLVGQYEEFMSAREVSDAQLKSMVATCDKITEKTQDRPKVSEDGLIIKEGTVADRSSTAKHHKD